MFKQVRFAEISKILALAIPLIISHIAIIGMEVIDTIMAGQASAEDLAGLAIGGNIWLIIEVAMGGLISAITPRIARFHGAKQFADITRDTQQALLMGAFIGLIAMFVMLAIVPFLPLLGTSAQVTEISQGYAQIIAYSLPVSAICWVLFCLLEGHGLMRFVVVSSLVAVSLNLLLDYIFVFGKFGFPALGGVGCAWTTTTIYWFWGLACVIYTARHKQLKAYQIYAKFPRFDWQRWRAILALGIPISLALLAEEGFFSVTALMIAPLGTEPLGAHQITIQVVSLVLMVGLGVGQATAIRVAQSIGKNQHSEQDTTNKSIISSMTSHISAGFSLILFVALVVGIGVFSFRDNLPYLFTQDQAIALISSTIMIFAIPYLLSDALQVWAAQTLRGFEDTKVPMLFQITSYWLIGFPLGYSLGASTFWGENYGVFGFWLGFLAGVMIGSCLLSTRLYFKAKRFNSVTV